jgi:hypothetical protein
MSNDTTSVIPRLALAKIISPERKVKAKLKNFPDCTYCAPRNRNAACVSVKLAFRYANSIFRAKFYTTYKNLAERNCRAARPANTYDFALTLNVVTLCGESMAKSVRGHTVRCGILPAIHFDQIADD